MPDPLYLSLWFPHFETIEMLPRAVTVMNQFPFSTGRPGVTYLALHPVSWGEATVLEQRYDYAESKALFYVVQGRAGRCAAP